MTAIATPRHRVSVATARVHAELDAVADASVWSMDAHETAATLVEIVRAEAKLVELKARVGAHADDLHVGQDVGASNAANWLAHTLRITRPAAGSLVKLGHALDAHPQTRDALAAGDIVEEQARVIIRWVDALPDELDAATVVKAEAYLLDQARHHDARGLGQLGKRLMEVAAPEAADAHEAELLAREEAAAAKACRLTMADDGHGKTFGRFTIPTYQAAALRKALRAIAAREHSAGPDAMGQAFCELIERYPTNKLPKAGGLNAAVVVTISYESLVGQIEQAGILDTGEHISPSLARKIACDAAILPAVLGGKSVVLDLGRKRRYFSEAQRIALGLRNGGCTADGCDKPPAMTDAHHDHEWSRGGTTNLTNGRLLCRWHHTKIHDPDYQTTHLPGGKVIFHRRT